MGFRVSILVLLMVFVAIGAQAGDRSLFSVSELVDQYYAKKDSADTKGRLAFTLRLRGPRDCDPQGQQSCIELICDKLGTFGCDTTSEIQEVGRACRGNPDGTCVDAVCTKLGTFGCDTMSEVRDVARACVGNFDIGCFESVCRRLGTFGCDTQAEVDEVLRSCSGY